MAHQPSLVFFLQCERHIPVMQRLSSVPHFIRIPNPYNHMSRLTTTGVMFFSSKPSISLS